VTAFLGLGSNLGEREEHLREGVRLLCDSLKLIQVSSVYETEPWGYTDQPPFLNLVCEIETDQTSHQVLKVSKKVERQMGRSPTFRYGPRVLDIDILLYGDQVISTVSLTVPHPGMAERAFVLVPLAEIAATRVHPVLRLSVGELLAQAPGVDGVRLFLAQSRRLRSRNACLAGGGSGWSPQWGTPPDTDRKPGFPQRSPHPPA
jgi:2-amino-4-hydroxy-6-hydroxymethyldihydropteridine diphosphokinase